ncbi:MAG TPA: hypothetical protein VFJ07_11480, partial [Streptosporangiaceae bacterium]|nr:hypothetical protein [Streptosporangiaceae bacterium]
DSQDIRWGCWPQTGTQWIELDWAQPITTNGSSVYFLETAAVSGCPRRGWCSTGTAAQSGLGSVGVIQWVVPSIPSS